MHAKRSRKGMKKRDAAGRNHAKKPSNSVNRAVKNNAGNEWQGFSLDLLDKGIARDFSEFITSVWRSLGIDSLSAKIFSIIFLSPRDVAMDELAEKTGYSLASISLKMKLLEGVALVKKKKKPGSKKIYYSCEKDFFVFLKKKLDAIHEKEIMPAKQRLPPMLESYKKRNSKAEEYFYGFVEGYYRSILKLEKILAEMQKLIVCSMKK